MAVAQTDPCPDSLPALLSRLTQWSQEADSGRGYPFTSFESGACLALGYRSGVGFTVPERQMALWPANIFGLSDSTYRPIRAFTWNEAESLLVLAGRGERGAIVLANGPVVVTGIDTSFGAPWFFVTRCDSVAWVSDIWDRDDFKKLWWGRFDAPAAGVIWPIPKPEKVKMGRNLIKAGMRNAVLAARPDSSATSRYGLAAAKAAAANPDSSPGSTATLERLARLRRLGSQFLTEEAELWPPGERDPVKLAAFYLQRSAEAWQTVAAVASTWMTYDAGQRRDWLAAIDDWETKAAVALDNIVSGTQ